METEAPVDRSISPKLWIIGGVVVVPLLLVVGLVVVWVLQNQTTVVPSSAIAKTQTDTVPLGKKLIHGELAGSIVSGKSFAGRVVAMCTTEKARVLKKGTKILLECPNKGVKTASIGEENTFSIRLLPDTYIVTVPLEGKEKSIQVPTQLTIAADTKTILPIVVDEK